MATTKEIVDPASRILAMVVSQEVGISRVFIQAVDLIKDNHTLDILAALLEQGRFEEAVAGVEAAAALLGNQYGESLVESAKETAAFLSGALSIAVSFDVSNVRASDIMRRGRLELIREFAADQRTTLRQVMAEGIQEGLNPREQARRFRDSIGLTSKQNAAVSNYRRMLESTATDPTTARGVFSRRLRDRRFDSTIQGAIDDGRALTAEQIDRMTDRYRERYVKYRSEVIGRTEALRAVHQGTEEMYNQAIDDGHLDADSLRRTWVTARDERVRSSHAALNGDTNPIGEPWQGADGTLRYPGDPEAPASETVQCRCVLSTRVTPI